MQKEGRGGNVSLDLMAFEFSILSTTLNTDENRFPNLRTANAFSLLPFFFLLGKSRQEGPTKVLEVFVLNQLWLYRFYYWLQLVSQAV